MLPPRTHHRQPAQVTAHALRKCSATCFCFSQPISQLLTGALHRDGGAQNSQTSGINRKAKNWHPGFTLGCGNKKKEREERGSIREEGTAKFDTASAKDRTYFGGNKLPASNNGKVGSRYAAHH